MSVSPFTLGGLVLRTAAASTVLAGALVGVSLAPGTEAVPAAGASAQACGATLGPVQLEGAAGSSVFVLPVLPTVPGQACNATLSVAATIETSGGIRPSDVAGNGLVEKLTVSFLPGQPPPDLLWQLSPACADPADLPYRFYASSPTAGAVSSAMVGTTPCSAWGTTGATLYPAKLSISNPEDFVAMAPVPDDSGYWLATRGSDISRFGDAPDLTTPYTSAPLVGLADASANGYWWAASDGGVFALGDAPFLGSLGSTSLDAPVVGIAATPDGEGYWLVAADGGVFAFGDAAFYGSVPGALGPAGALNAPVVGIASTPDGKGYWLVAADGGVFAFGDAAFWGSTGGLRLNASVVGMVANALGGYWLVAADGGVFAFHAAFEGSLGAVSLNAPVVAVAASRDGQGYWLLGADGGVFAFGDAPFLGSAA